MKIQTRQWTIKSAVSTCVLFGVTIFTAPAAFATQIQYLTIPAGAVSGDILILPNYGRVGFSHDYAGQTGVTVLHNTTAENHSAGSYSWGADTDRFNVLNGSQGSETYNVTFDFLDGTPDPARLLLVVAGLAQNSTVTLSAAGLLTGEYTFPSNVLACGGACPNGSAPTTMSMGTMLSSGYSGVLTDPGFNTDSKNTGWALVRLNSGVTSLNLNVSQERGDGMGFTLAYTAAPEPASWALIAVGLSLVGWRRLRFAAAASARQRRCVLAQGPSRHGLIVEGVRGEVSSR